MEPPGSEVSPTETLPLSPPAPPETPAPPSQVLEYPPPVSTDEIIQVYDRINASKTDNGPGNDVVSLDKVLANFQGNEVEVDTPQVTVEPKTTEDLLAILEGDNDRDSPPPPRLEIPKKKPLDRETEKSLALKQLKEMPSGKRKPPKNLNKILDVKIPPSATKRILVLKPKSAEAASSVETYAIDVEEPKTSRNNAKKSVADISFIAEDWADEDACERPSDENDVPANANSNLGVRPNVLNGKLASVVDPEKVSESNQDDSLVSKRTSRLIKKKIIWDPDNPATFKIASSSVSPQQKNDGHNSNSNSHSKAHSVQTKLTKHFSPKILNSEKPDRSSSRSNSSFSLGKKKKMSELDKLLMDEGAVNMIYQLERSNNNINVPELLLKPNNKSMISISRERRNLINKTKIIKNAVFSVTKSNDSDSKETKVIRTRREYVKTFKKPKSSNFRNSIQSPSHSEVSIDAGADESRIIRRHSSSSFSSGCLSPRPQSPLELSLNSNKSKESDSNFEKLSNNGGKNDDSGIQDIMQNSTNYSLEKKGSKRKYFSDNINREKKTKIKNSQFKKKLESLSWSTNSFNSKAKPVFTNLTLDITSNLASIIIKSDEKFNGLFNIDILQELIGAIYAATEADVKVLSLTSHDKILCNGLDLRCLLQDSSNELQADMNNYLETFRELLVQIIRFKGVIITGVNGICSSFGVILALIADFVVASKFSTFCISPEFRRSLPIEGVSLFNHLCSMPLKLKNEFILCGTTLTATEALKYNLITQICETESFNEDFKKIVEEISDRPTEVFQLYKSVSRDEENSKMITSLDKECILLADYWYSTSGQDAIQHCHSHL